MDPTVKRACEKIVMGKAKFNANCLGLGLLFTRLVGVYNAAPNPATLSKSIAEIEAFFKKYDSILAADKLALQKV